MHEKIHDAIQDFKKIVRNAFDLVSGRTRRLPPPPIPPAPPFNPPPRPPLPYQSIYPPTPASPNFPPPIPSQQESQPSLSQCPARNVAGRDDEDYYSYNLATERQTEYLRYLGYEGTPDISQAKASQLIGEYVSGKRKRTADRKTLDTLKVRDAQTRSQRERKAFHKEFLQDKRENLQEDIHFAELCFRDSGGERSNQLLGWKIECTKHAPPSCKMRFYNQVFPATLQVNELAQIMPRYEDCPDNCDECRAETVLFRDVFCASRVLSRIFQTGSLSAPIVEFVPCDPAKRRQTIPAYIHDDRQYCSSLKQRWSLYTALALVVLVLWSVVSCVHTISMNSVTPDPASQSQNVHKKPVKKKHASEQSSIVPEQPRTTNNQPVYPENEVKTLWNDYGFDINGYAQYEGSIRNGKYGEDMLYADYNTLWSPYCTKCKVDGNTLYFVFYGSYACPQFLLDNEEPLSTIFEIAAQKFLVDRHAVREECLLNLEFSFEDIAKEAISKTKEGKFSISFVYFITPEGGGVLPKDKVTHKEFLSMDEIAMNEYLGDTTYHASYDVEILRHAFRFTERNREDDDTVSPTQNVESPLSDSQDEYEFPYRVWKSRAGSMIYAKIQSFSGDAKEITLIQEDGKTFTLKLSQLTDFDADQAKQQITRKRRMDNEK